MRRPWATSATTSWRASRRPRRSQAPRRARPRQRACAGVGDGACLRGAAGQRRATAAPGVGDRRRGARDGGLRRGAAAGFATAGFARAASRPPPSRRRRLRRSSPSGSGRLRDRGGLRGAPSRRSSASAVVAFAQWPASRQGWPSRPALPSRRSQLRGGGPPACGPAASADGAAVAPSRRASPSTSSRCVPPQCGGARPWRRCGPRGGRRLRGRSLGGRRLGLAAFTVAAVADAAFARSRPSSSRWPSWRPRPWRGRRACRLPTGQPYDRCPAARRPVVGVDPVRCDFPWRCVGTVLVAFSSTGRRVVPRALASGGSGARDGLRSLDEEVVLVERTHAPDFRWTAFHMHSRGEERGPCKHAVTSS